MKYAVFEVESIFREYDSISGYFVTSPKTLEILSLNAITSYKKWASTYNQITKYSSDKEKVKKWLQKEKMKKLLLEK